MYMYMYTYFHSSHYNLVVANNRRGNPPSPLSKGKKGTLEKKPSKHHYDHCFIPATFSHFSSLHCSPFIFPSLPLPAPLLSLSPCPPSLSLPPLSLSPLSLSPPLYLPPLSPSLSPSSREYKQHYISFTYNQLTWFR